MRLLVARRFAAGQLALLAAETQDRAPAAGAGIALARAIGENFDLPEGRSLSGDELAGQLEDHVLDDVGRFLAVTLEALAERLDDLA